jgi:hypothetical protein
MDTLHGGWSVLLDSPLDNAVNMVYDSSSSVAAEGNMRPLAHAFTTKVTVPLHRNAAARGFLRSSSSGRVEVSSQATAWGHRKIHRLGFTLPARRTGLSARDRNKDTGQVVRQTRTRVNRCRHGALGGCFKVSTTSRGRVRLLSAVSSRTVGTFKHLAGRGQIAWAITLGVPMEKEE